MFTRFVDAALANRIVVIMLIVVLAVGVARQEQADQRDDERDFRCPFPAADEAAFQSQANHEGAGDAG